MLELLKKADYSVFSLINGHHDPIIDFLMFWISDKWIWIPFYLWLLYIIIRTFGRKTLAVAIVIAMMIVVSDQFSVLVKNTALRLRPCHDPQLSDSIHLVNAGCGGSYGFFSSHASNTMALVFFLFMILPKRFKILRMELVAYLLLVGYSRIYLGAHFPGDILAGWIAGLVVGIIGAFIYINIRKYNNKWI